MTDPLDEDPRTTTREADTEAPIGDEELVVHVVAGPDRGASLVLERGTYLVGKLPECALRLSDGEVSRGHVELRMERHGVVVRDLGSKNGTFYRGARITEALVGLGAVVTVGATQLLFARRTPPGAPAASTADRFGRLRGRSLVMRRLFAVLERVAATDSPVLIEAETGCGKELCAEALHRAGARAAQPLIVCDLSALPRSLIDSELFGHVKGAFTGAAGDRVGAFEAAHGGTLFLDELGELERDLQPRLLRALESAEIRRVGETRYRSVDVRVIAATNRDLQREVQSGGFRADLFHRLAVVRVRIPPLRERREDIPLLVEELLAERGGRASAETMEVLQEYDWPGNVRELRNVIERGLAILPPGAVLEPSVLGLDARPALATPGEPADYHAAKQRLLEGWERRFIDELLKATGGSVTEAARRCGLGRSHLYRLIEKYGLKG